MYLLFHNKYLFKLNHFNAILKMKTFGANIANIHILLERQGINGTQDDDFSVRMKHVRR